MEVEEKREPDWSQCPRNPEFVAFNILDNLHSDVVNARQEDVRLLRSLSHLNRLMRMRAAAEGSKEP